MNTDPPILSFNECLLRQSDVDLLKGPFWLNDNVISFYFEYLGENDPQLLFITPEVTQCIKIIPVSQIRVFLDPLHCIAKPYIFFALNDNDQPQTAGGTHWSLLVYSRTDDVVFHYDSAMGSNAKQAERFSRKIMSYLGVEGSFMEKACLQQKNNYDCGIHLINNAQFLAKCIETHGDIKNCNLNSSIVENSANMMREQLLELIEKLRNR